MKEYDKRLIRDLAIGEKTWASSLSAFIDDGSLCVLLDTSVPCVPVYEYPYMLSVWRREDGFYVAERTNGEDPTCFVKAQLAERPLWNGHLEEARREALKLSYIRPVWP